MTRRISLALVLVGAGALPYAMTVTGAKVNQAPHVTSPAVVTSPAPLPSFVDVGPTPVDRAIAFELVLAFPGHEQMGAYARSVADPSSADYRRFLNAEEIGSRFGLADADLARVTDWASAHGISVGARQPQRIAVAAEAPAGTVEAAFGVTLREYRAPAGRTFHAPVGEASVPKALSGLVSAVAGLDARPKVRPSSWHPIAAGPEGGMTPSIIDRVYELEGLRALNLNGEGQVVAIASLDTFDPADIETYDGLAGTSGPSVERIAVNGGVETPGDDQDEVSLDVEIVRAVAPKAQILDYEAPNRGPSLEDIIDRIVADGRADIVTISWDSCELDALPSEMVRTARSFAAAGAAGISVFTSSGDHGAYDCIDQDRADLRVSVGSPSGGTNAIAVGGTYLSMLEDGTYLDEVAWEEPLTGWAPGGGLSVYNRRPSWQVGLGVDNARSNGFRQVPDVAAAADPTSGFMIVSGGETGAIGGTSAASPFWAGLAVLVRQLAAREGVDGLGPLGPILYGVAAAQPPGSVFRDVTRGGNLMDNAAPGWDYATGLGTPRGTSLARAIVDQLKGRR